MNTKTHTRRALRGGKRAWPSARIIHRSSFIIVAIAFLSGCGGKQEAAVSGTVTMNGTPLTTGSVTFNPTDGAPPAYGSIKPDGSYALATGSQRGLKSGDYVATVVATGRLEPVPGQDEPVGKLLTPAKYGDLKTSPLHVTVKPGSNYIPLELK